MIETQVKVTHEILRQRAERLSRCSIDKTVDETIEVVEFQLANEHYAIESIYAQEVYPLKGLIKLPCTPSFVAGLINVRRKILSVIDLKQIFDLPAQEVTNQCKVILLEHNGIEFGILADAILGVHPVSIKDLQPSLPTLTGVRQDFLKGVTNERLIVLDGHKLLTDKQLVVQAAGE